MYKDIMNKKELDNVLVDIDKSIKNINESFKAYKHWNSSYIEKYRNEKGESIIEIILNHIHKNINIK